MKSNQPLIISGYVCWLVPVHSQSLVHQHSVIRYSIPCIWKKINFPVSYDNVFFWNNGKSTFTQILEAPIFKKSYHLMLRNSSSWKYPARWQLTGLRKLFVVVNNTSSQFGGFLGCIRTVIFSSCTTPMIKYSTVKILSIWISSASAAPGVCSDEDCYEYRGDFLLTTKYIFSVMKWYYRICKTWSFRQAVNRGSKIDKPPPINYALKKIRTSRQAWKGSVKKHSTQFPVPSSPKKYRRRSKKRSNAPPTSD